MRVLCTIHGRTTAAYATLLLDVAWWSSELSSYTAHTQSYQRTPSVHSWKTFIKVYTAAERLSSKCTQPIASVHSEITVPVDSESDFTAHKPMYALRNMYNQPVHLNEEQKVNCIPQIALQCYILWTNKNRFFGSSFPLCALLVKSHPSLWKETEVPKGIREKPSTYQMCIYWK